METFICIAVVGGIILLVSFIGNKIVDGAANALRPKHQKPDGTPQYTKSENLADRYNNTDFNKTKDS